MNFKLPAVLRIGVICLTFQTAATVAIGAEGDQMRILGANELRSYSRQVSANACHVAEGIKVESSVAALETATNNFDTIIAALRNGNDARGISSGETRRKTLAEIAAVEAAWQPTRDAAMAIVSGAEPHSSVVTILDDSDEVLIAAEKLLVELTSQYSNPADMVQADAFLIEIASRQRMLIQEMAKQSCMISAGLAKPETPDDLTASMQVFDASLTALRDGLPSAGVRPPPTPEIAEQLSAIFANWGDVRPTLETLGSGEMIEKTAEAEKIDVLYQMMIDMTQTVMLYRQALGS